MRIISFGIFVLVVNFLVQRTFIFLVWYMFSTYMYSFSRSPQFSFQLHTHKLCLWMGTYVTECSRCKTLPLWCQPSVQSSRVQTIINIVDCGSQRRQITLKLYVGSAAVRTSTNDCERESFIRMCAVQLICLLQQSDGFSNSEIYYYNTIRAGTARPTCALCSKVMLVKSIYILNVVVK